MTTRWMTVVVIAMLLPFEFAFAQGGYGGPSMLSRGGNRPGRRGSAPVDLAVYGGLRGTVETGLTPVRLEQSGEIAKENRYGVQAEIGAYGSHAWRRTSMGLDYRGDYRKLMGTRAFDGTNQAISFDLSHTPNARTQFFFRNTGGITNRAFGGFAAPAGPTDDSLDLVNNELFDSKMYFNQANAGITLRTSARLAYSFSGNHFFVKRVNRQLTSVAGYGGAAAVSYRWSARTTISGQYQHIEFQYKSVYGHTAIDGGAFTFERQITRNFDVTLTGGGLRVHTVGTQQVELSEEVAAILGRTRGVSAFSRQDWVPQATAAAGYTLERSRFQAQISSAVVPGNGVYLTSQRQGASAGYSFTGTRNLSFGLSARYARLKSLGVDLRNMKVISGGGGMNYRLGWGLNFSTQLDYRSFDTPVRGREGFMLAVGLTFSRARLPLSIW